MTTRRGIMVVVLVSAVVAGCASAPSSSVSPAASAVAPSADAGQPGSGSPEPGTGATLATAFLERIRDPGARYRLDETLTLVVGQNSSKAVSHSDVAGADMIVISDKTVGGTTTHSEYLESGGTVFERNGGDDWHATGPVDAKDVPFPFLKASDMRYAGRQIRDAEFLESYSLAQAIPIGASIAESLGVKGGSASIVVFDAFLQTDGSPIRIEVAFQITAADGSAAGNGTIAQDYADFGGEVVVEPPVG